MRFFISILLVCCLGLTTKAQTQSMLFEKWWGDFVEQGIYFADELSNGDYFLVGSKRTPAVLNYACRMTPSGNIIWEKDWGYTYNGISNLHKYGDDYILVGSGDWASCGGISDIEITRMDVDGNIIFDKFFNYNYQDFGVTICDTYDRNFIVSALGGSLGSHIPIFYKIDPDGNQIWRRVQSGYTNYVADYIEQTPDSGFVVAGSSPANAYYAKYDKNGIMQWIKYPFGTSPTSFTCARSLRMNENGSFEVYWGVDCNSAIPPYNHIYGSLKKYDASGNCISTREYSNGLYSIYPDKNDSFYMGRSSYGVCYKTDEHGNFKFEVSLEGADTLRKFIERYIQTSDGGYLGVGGYTWDSQNIPTTFYVAKFSIDKRYNADEFSESVNAYPNPSSDGNFNLTFDMKSDEDVDVRVFTTEGKLIYSNTIFCPANSHTELPVRLDYSSTETGMYILEARTKEAVIRKKLLIVRDN